MTDIGEEREVAIDIQEGMSPSRATQNREFSQDDQQFGGGAGEQEYGVFVDDPRLDPEKFRGDLLPDDEIVEVKDLQAADGEAEREAAELQALREAERAEYDAEMAVEGEMASGLD